MKLTFHRKRPVTEAVARAEGTAEKLDGRRNRLPHMACKLLCVVVAQAVRPALGEPGQKCGLPFAFVV